MQQLLLVHTNAGNLLPLLDSIFDYQWGTKDNPRTYQQIVDHLEVPPGKVLFIGDTAAQVNAASQAGLKVALIQRNGKKTGTPLGGGNKTIIDSLEELEFK